MAIGAGLWLAPRLSMRVLGFDPDNPETLTVSRLAGGRDLAMGAVAFAAASDPERAAATVRVNAAVDAGDAIAFLALGRRNGPGAAAVLGTLTATAATGAGLWLASKLA
jgi:hypothetical protein